MLPVLSDLAALHPEQVIEGGVLGYLEISPYIADNGGISMVPVGLRSVVCYDGLAFPRGATLAISRPARKQPTT